MITKNFKMLAIAAMVAIVGSVSGINSIYGHTFSSWSDADHEYYCTASLDDISSSSNVDPCGDLSSAANVWNNANASWDLTEATTWNSDASSVFGTNLGEDVVGYMSPYASAPDPFVTAYVAFNTHSSIDYGDIAVGETGTGWVDYKSVAGHEFGHLAGIDHNSSSLSVMYASISTDQILRSPNWHDKAELGVLYP
jgi:hypothetical protein